MRRAGCRSRRHRSYLRTRASAKWLQKRSQRLRSPYDPAAPAGRPVREAMYALNFYSPVVADQLGTRRKTATIRLGDKSQKYKKGMIVQVLTGSRYSPRQKVFEAVIDKVDVKRLGGVSARGIEHDNP